MTTAAVRIIISRGPYHGAIVFIVASEYSTREPLYAEKKKQGATTFGKLDLGATGRHKLLVRFFLPAPMITTRSAHGHNTK